MFYIIILVLIIWLLAEIFRDRMKISREFIKKSGKTDENTVFEKVNEEGEKEYYDENGKIDDISERIKTSGVIPKGLIDALKPLLIVLGVIIIFRFLPYLLGGFFGIVVPVLFFMFIVDPEGMQKRLKDLFQKFFGGR